MSTSNIIVIPSRKRDASRIVRYIEGTNASEIQSINASLLAERPTGLGRSTQDKESDQHGTSQEYRNRASSRCVAWTR
jgi:hypothetical protein